jgi:hypothetical protein
VAEDGADADAGTAHADAGDTCANKLCGLRVHDDLLFVLRLDEFGPQ